MDYARCMNQWWRWWCSECRAMLSGSACTQRGCEERRTQVSRLAACQVRGGCASGAHTPHYGHASAAWDSRTPPRSPLSLERPPSPTTFLSTVLDSQSLLALVYRSAGRVALFPLWPLKYCSNVHATHRIDNGLPPTGRHRPNELISPALTILYCCIAQKRPSPRTWRVFPIKLTSHQSSESVHVHASRRSLRIAIAAGDFQPCLVPYEMQGYRIILPIGESPSKAHHGQPPCEVLNSVR